MKGLMEVSPAVLGVKINARAARRFYGVEIHKKYSEWLHDPERR